MMNERIKEIKLQAQEYAGQYGFAHRVHGQDLIDILDQKFVELIVRECAMVAIKKQTENDIDNIVSENPAKDFADALVKHFGVK